MVAITAALYQLECFDEQFRELVERACAQGGADLGRHRAELRVTEAALQREKENLLAAVCEFGPKPNFQDRLAEWETKDRDLRLRRHALERPPAVPKLSRSVCEFRERFEQTFQDLAVNSLEFGDSLRLVVASSS